MDVREIVRGIKERHGRSSAAKYDADSDNIPQRLLMPSSEDPSLWRVRVKVSPHVREVGGADERLEENKSSSLRYSRK
jgi:hypothetical protein